MGKNTCERVLIHLHTDLFICCYLGRELYNLLCNRYIYSQKFLSRIHFHEKTEKPVPNFM